jgi:Flp pilus assembly protein TadD
MYHQALRDYEKSQNTEHDEDLRIVMFSTVNNLGSLYWTQGKLAEAETMFHRALRGYEKSQTTEYGKALRVAVFNTMNNLVVVYRNQGKLAEAETIYHRAKTGMEKLLSDGHYITLSDRTFESCSIL